jgi:hypothetical protein
MRTVFDNQMVYHVWAQQSQDHGRNAKESASFQGATAYSYRAAIARFVDKDTVLFSNRRWSVTTASHQSDAQRAASHVKNKFWVRDIGGTFGNVDHGANLAWFGEQILSTATKAKRARSNKEWLLSQVQEVVSQANRYAAHFGLKERYAVPSDLDVQAELAKAREIARKEAMARKEREERQARIREEQRQEALATLEKWKAGEDVRLSHLFDADIALRVKGDELQTSRGATVPLHHATRLLPLIRSGQAYQRNGHTEHVGHFALDSIDEAGNIKVGCHNIGREEVERVASQLGI